MTEKDYLEFKGGWLLSFIPMAVFFIFCILLFIVYLSYDMHALAMGGFVGLLIGSLFAKDSGRYWESAIQGIASPGSITIVLILFVVGMFSQMIKDSNASEEFIWIATYIGMSGGIFVAFTFISCCIIATATGSSIGTMFAAFPVFYAAGTALGASPMFLAGAITLVISVFGIMGVLQAAGTINRLIEWILNSRMVKTVRGTEIAIALGACLTCSLFGGVTSAAILTFGPVIDEIGNKKQIHPYRRANLLDGFVNTLPVVIPFLSVFVFITVALSGLSPMEVAKGFLYPVCLFVVLAIAVISGWGVRYEGEDGKQLKTPPTP
jgi:Na+/H+ antiporter NhaC